ncbi:caspase family protein [Allorhodopirellula solitaria]|uniref:Caspase domain protein n=1 Tax=Allorhodopirellula solitaria TaxID=2527987 RepID=A0A5C5WPM2_9BACT|nr:caspase family protein [Allorhodopirellula solitaria]TWT51802.1 Caspase domain protein [Allorhodopirellula solitaria]
MAGNIYALLVGINDYSPAVGKLAGCVNDVDHFRGYLTDNFEKARLRIEVLKDAEATRPNIIEQFRSHLSKAKAEDVVVFQYCGHGARWKSAKAFEQFYPDGMDEGLVCYDSRSPGGFDLADKELAVLLSELAKNEPHIAVILDSCHSGSSTRCADDFALGKCRQTHQVFDERPLDSYVDGYYTAVEKNGERLEIPPSQHILLAACQRIQKAFETREHSGVFTSTLLDVLHKSKSDLAYADLFMRCRAMVNKRADNQDPQFETFYGFNAYSGFLGSETIRRARRYSVYFDDDSWMVDCGALHGLPTEPDVTTELTLYREKSPSLRAGRAVTTQVGAQKSQLDLADLKSDEETRYLAEVTSLPVPPLPVLLEGEAKKSASLQESLSESEDQSIGISFLTASDQGTAYALNAADDGLRLQWRETGKLIQGTIGTSIAATEYMIGILKRIADWERAVKLQNQSTKMNRDDVQFQFSEVLDDDSLHPYDSNEITLDIREQGENWSEVQGKFTANNRTAQPLHFVLVHLSDDFGITMLYKERVEPTKESFTLTPMGESVVNLLLNETDGDEVTHTFKLIVSTEEVDDFLLGQDGLEIGKIFNPRGTRAAKGLSFGKSRRKLIHKNEWFTKDLRIRLIRQLDRVSAKETTLAGGKIKIKGHSSLKAAVSLSGAKSGTRDSGNGADFYWALERQGMDLLNFAGTRGDVQNVLELTDIQNPEALQDHPLEIALKVDLADNEFILPLVFDGEDILLAGDPQHADDGTTHITISGIPECRDNRRSLGSALKLYFFKTYLKRDNVNRLCWIEYKPDGSFERHRSDIAEKVAAAQNVLLLIHGIIGDTDGIAQGLSLAKDADGKNVSEKFDLVLTYDYENLSTPILDTAVKLKQQLASVGLDVNKDKGLTLLVHSMGGLVARWFIEREGGNQVVDHLVMFGTPNVGSPFGLVDLARKLSSMLTTLAIATFPGFTPFCGALVYLLNRSKKVTPTLEQMNPTSDFITTLNSSPDPGVPYTIVAGDIRDYQDSADQIMARLVAKVGTGIAFDALYHNDGHDIAVSDDSIRGIADDRIPAPTKHNVVCHHLNYFISEAGLKTLAEIQWSRIGGRTFDER